MTSLRGTEPDMSYMVAFMDYAKAISRVRRGVGAGARSTTPWRGWLNSTRVAPQIFADYAQTLDMYDATLTTRYHFDYANKSTDVKVTTFVSQAANHIADATVDHAAFQRQRAAHVPIGCGPNTPPRFPIGKLTGEQMIAAVIASGQTLENKPIPMSDRDAVWYHGVTRIVAADGDAKDRTLWLDGRAEGGPTMAPGCGARPPQRSANRGRQARKERAQAVTECFGKSG